jgi:hypothetical protein
MLMNHHNSVQWLSLSKVLKSVWDFKDDRVGRGFPIEIGQSSNTRLVWCGKCMPYLSSELREENNPTHERNSSALSVYICLAHHLIYYLVVATQCEHVIS